VHEVAFRLELSNIPFLWALRKPNWFAGDDVNEDHAIWLIERYGAFFAPLAYRKLIEIEYSANSDVYKKLWARKDMQPRVLTSFGELSMTCW